MRIDLSGRTALVTGSTTGIGRAIASGLAVAGAEVIINGRTADRVERAVAEVGETAGAQGRVRGVAADVGTAEGCEALIAAAPDVDVLVNNTGIFGQRPAFEISDEEWMTVFETNVMSGIRLSRHHIPRMVDRDWGRVIFISSESALHIPPEMVHYGMTKTAQLAISRGFAESVAGTGVTVNSVLPGPTLSQGLRHAVEAEAGEEKSFEEAGREWISANRPSSIIGRPAELDEVASMVVYVASPQASATTGAVLRVDGGVVRAIP
jgi:NAD(P)-dependent dehydrogenase (short-subunit alcohol dehydrogenase family)